MTKYRSLEVSRLHPDTEIFKYLESAGFSVYTELGGGLRYVVKTDSGTPDQPYIEFSFSDSFCTSGILVNQGLEVTFSPVDAIESLLEFKETLERIGWLQHIERI